MRDRNKTTFSHVNQKPVFKNNKTTFSHVNQKPVFKNYEYVFRREKLSVNLHHSVEGKYGSSTSF